MNETKPDAQWEHQVEQDRQLLRDARGQGRGSMFKAFIKLSGPGWLQSAITLGGGSLSQSLYLGVLGGFALLWLQPLAMILGVIMLSAISYVTLSTGERPFQAINKHINPVLGWGWALATLAANLVWSMPQFSLATAATQQNLMPQLAGDTGKVVICAAIVVICIAVIWFYDSGSRGVRIFEWILKGMVGIIVLCFFGVIIRLSMAGTLDWGAIFSGLLPNPRMLTAPASTFDPFFVGISDTAREYWSSLIVGKQRDVMMGAAATAVGINMTFLLPYSMLRKGWDKHFRGLAIFDLSTGLFIPFILVTGCVVIAAASQFHATPEKGLVGVVELDPTAASGKLEKEYIGLLTKRLVATAPGLAEGGAPLHEAIRALPENERKLAASLVTRDSVNLSNALAPFTGKAFSNYIFGLGVVAMTVSSIIILMLINGFVVCEMFNLPPRGWANRLAAMMPLIGVLGPFFWTKAAFWLAVPTSVFGLALIFIAYWTFFFMMNSESLMGDSMPRGARRWRWNILMILAAGIMSYGSFYAIWSKVGWLGIIGLSLFLGLAFVVHFVRKATPNPS